MYGGPKRPEFDKKGIQKEDHLHISYNNNKDILGGLNGCRFNRGHTVQTSRSSHINVFKVKVT